MYKLVHANDSNGCCLRHSSGYWPLVLVDGSDGADVGNAIASTTMLLLWPLFAVAGLSATNPCAALHAVRFAHVSSAP